MDGAGRPLSDSRPLHQHLALRHSQHSRRDGPPPAPQSRAGVGKHGRQDSQRHQRQLLGAVGILLRTIHVWRHVAGALPLGRQFRQSAHCDTRHRHSRDGLAHNLIAPYAARRHPDRKPRPGRRRGGDRPARADPQRHSRLTHRRRRGPARSHRDSVATVARP